MRRPLAAIAVSLMLMLPAHAADVTIDTATGPATIAAHPHTVAVFDIAALDTLAALGVQPAGVPAPVYLETLAPVAAQAQTVGTLFEPDFEALAVMQPDLIVVGGRSSPQAEALSDFAPTIDMTIWGDGLVDQARSRIAAYGTLFGIEDRADTLIATLNASLDTARQAVSGQGGALILLTNGGKISAYGANSRFGWLHSDLGLPEAVAGLQSETHGQAVSFEFVLQADPAWLLVIDRGAAIGAGDKAAQATLDNPVIARSRAAQSGQIVHLDAAPLYIAGGGASAIQHTLAQIVAAFGAVDR